MEENMYFSLFKNRSFMAFWGATTLLRLSSNILQFALAIYVLDLTESALVYSTVLSVIILPRIFCTSIAGYLADFKDNIRILRWGTFGLMGLMAGFLTIHIFVVPLNVPFIYALVISLELCETFLGPAEGKALLCIVKEKEISPASKISSLDDGIVEILSPIIAGLFYGRYGLTSVLNITFALEGGAFLLTTLIRRKSEQMADVDNLEQVSTFSLKSTYIAYREAILCLKKHPYVIGFMLFAPLFNFFVSPLFSVTAPHYFRITMNANVEMYSMFNMALGVAGLIAPFIAMVLINDKDEYKANKGGVIASNAVLICLLCILYFGSEAISVNGALYTVTGAMAFLVVIVTIMNIATSITIKKHISEQIIGRVISMIQLCATISMPFGQLFYGFCIDKFSIITSYIISILGLTITYVLMLRTYRIINRK